MGPRDWILTVREELLALEIKTGIPCLFSGAQMVHEAFNWDGSLSALAERGNNWAGVKFREWQRQFGAYPVKMGTEEEVSGELEPTEDYFGWYSSRPKFMEAYTFLLTDPSMPYAGALQYKADPALYGRVVGLTWATDSRYYDSIQRWMLALWDVLGPPFSRRPVEITAYGEPLAHGWLEGSTAVAPVRELTLPGWRRVWYPADGIRPARLDLRLDILTHE